jgi:putative ABC transport system permease protein
MPEGITTNIFGENLMIKHILKLVWNRKRSSLLLMIEIFFSFLVLFVVVTLGVFYADNYSKPLGFSYENVWNVKIDMQNPNDDLWTDELVMSTEQVYLALKDFPEVEAAAGAFSAPYGSVFGINDRHSVNIYNGRELEMYVNEVTDGFRELLDLQLVQGRWFEKNDDGMNWKPVVINQRMSRELFGSDDPINKKFEPWSMDGEEYRVVGVIDDFRKNGEYSSEGNYLFVRRRLDNPQERPPRNILIKVRPGTTVEFEERLSSKLQSVARDWSFEMQSLHQMRERSLKLYLVPIMAGGLIVFFLMLMVVLGLDGVLWKNVTQRKMEIGLRRAKGATIAAIYKQILSEILLLTSFGLAVGVFVVIQIPLLDLLGFISAKVYFSGLVVSLILIYCLTAIAGLYPSWLATKAQPADALRYE